MSAGETDGGELRLRAEAVQWREVDGEVIALDEQDAAYLAGNSTATLLWRALAEGTTRDALVQSLCEQYGVDEARAGTDVDAFLNQLRERKLLAP